MPAIVIRPAVVGDAETILRLVKELATFERQAHAVRATVEDIRRDGFGPQPKFEVLIAEADGRTAGFALMFPNYSTWEGRAGVYLEDLYVSEWARGRGLGRRLLAEVAALALARGCARLDLNVLDWNPARRFYEGLGLNHMASWLPYRIQDDALARLAARAPQ